MLNNRTDCWHTPSLASFAAFLEPICSILSSLVSNKYCHLAISYAHPNLASQLHCVEVKLVSTQLLVCGNVRDNDTQDGPTVVHLHSIWVVSPTRLQPLLAWTLAKVEHQLCVSKTRAMFNSSGIVILQ